jgi:hypothetical protein
MSKLAIYDQKFGSRDKKDNEYYRHDYIYRKNMWTRFYACIGAVIVMLIYWAYRIFALEYSVFEIDYAAAGRQAAIVILIVMAVYTIIGTMRETREFAKGQRRLKNYMKMLYILDRMREPEPSPTIAVKTKEDSNLYYGTNITNKGNDNTII